MIEIAIDGTAASGKGTLAKTLSKKYNFPHLDTGLIYRKVAYELIEKKRQNGSNLEKISCQIGEDLELINLNENNLRSEHTALVASKIAVFSELREILKKKQIEYVNFNKRKFGACILDGRDIGSVILPNANFKFFINASIEVRAKRRLLEKNISFLHQKDDECMLQSLINDMTKRDMSDKSRSISPLVPAKDAYIIDTSEIDAKELLSIAINIIEGKT